MKQKALKKTSKWASGNRKKARIISVLLSFLLIFIGAFYGELLKEFGLNINDNFKYLIIIVATLLMFTYPFISLRKRKIPKLFKYSYKRQKFHDFAIAFLTFFTIIFTFNKGYDKVFSEIIPTAYSADAKKEIKQTYIVNKQENRINVLDDDPKKEKRKNIVAFIILTIIFSILAWIAAIGVGALACSLACEGYHVTAWFVVIFGWGTIAFGLILIIRRLIKKLLKRKKKEA